MEQKTTSSQNIGSEFNKKSTFLASQPIEITRTFRAPVEQVWTAWTNPESTKKWWGPNSFTCPEAQIDLRVGGKYLLAMQGPDKKIIWGGGEYKEVIANKKFICTDYFCDKDGKMISANEAGMPGEWPDVLKISVDFGRVSEDQATKQINTWDK